MPQEVSALSTNVCTVTDPNPELEGEVNECGAPAVALFAWPWGDSGACCARHQFILNQKSQQLSQHLALSPLHVPAPAMTRDERTNMHAQILSLQDECEQLKHQGSQMYNDNIQLQTEGRRLLARSNDLDTRLAASLEAHGKTRHQLDEVLAERDELKAECNRLRLLVSNAPPVLRGEPTTAPMK
jgi:regulator of replication initiation timing